jgi:hypothetical protein
MISWVSKQKGHDAHRDNRQQQATGSILFLILWTTITSQHHSTADP